MDGNWGNHGGIMVPRSSLRPGDVAVSSHYGKSTVESVIVNQHEDGSTSVAWVKPWPEGKEKEPGYEYLARAHRSETYPNKSMIEVLSRGAVYAAEHEAHPDGQFGPLTLVALGQEPDLAAALDKAQADLDEALAAVQRASKALADAVVAKAMAS